MVSVLVEPLPGHTDEEVVDTLRRQGAREIDVLSPGFISAFVSRTAIEVLSAIADVHKKVVKQPLSAIHKG